MDYCGHEWSGRGNSLEIEDMLMISDDAGDIEVRWFCWRRVGPVLRGSLRRLMPLRYVAHAIRSGVLGNMVGWPW